jgi:hypothetical protein
MPRSWSLLSTVGFTLLVLGLTACAPSPAPAPPPAPAPTVAPVELGAVAEEYITASRVQGHIEFLAADEMRGRDTPSPELERAAEYLADAFRAMGLEPAGDAGSFLQRWPFQQLVFQAGESRARFEAGGERREWSYGQEYFAIPAPPRDVEGAPVYAATPEVTMMGLPPETEGAPLIVGLPDGLGPEFAMAVQAGMQAGAAGIVLIMDEDSDASDIFQTAAALEGGAAGEFPIPVLGVRFDVGQELLAAAGVEPEGGRDPPGARILEDAFLSFRSTFAPEVHEVPNVVALLRGSDPDLAEEYVIVTAHFDHVGVGPPDERGDSIYSGADDNASGTAAITEVARAFAALEAAPPRSVVFLAVSGEEKGLLGSAYYAGNPTVPSRGIVANLNLDMVSRNAPDTVHAIGEEFTVLGQWAHEVARDHPELGLTLAPDPEPEEQAFLRSDHFSFVQHRVPALMLTTWLHDDYHAPSDTPDRVDADKATRVARLAFLLTHRIAAEPDPPEWTAEGERLLEELAGTGQLR